MILKNNLQSNFFKLITIIIVIICVFSISDKSFAHINKIEATVNDKITILTSDIENQIKFINITTNEHLNINNPENKKNALNALIITILINQDAEKRNYNIPDSALPDIVSQIAKTQKITNDQLLEKIKKESLSNDTFLQLVKTAYKADSFKQAITASMAKISQVEIDNAINNILQKNGKIELHLYEISIPLSDPQAQEKIQKAYSLLKKGTNFNAVAAQYTNNITKSSEIGWILQDSLSSNVITALNEAGANHYTSVLLLENYYKIYLATEARQALQIDTKNPQQMEQLQTFVTQKMMFDKASILENTYIKDLITNASIKIYDK